MEISFQTAKLDFALDSKPEIVTYVATFAADVKRRLHDSEKSQLKSIDQTESRRIKRDQSREKCFRQKLRKSIFIVNQNLTPRALPFNSDSIMMSVSILIDTNEANA